MQYPPELSARSLARVEGAVVQAELKAHQTLSRLSTTDGSWATAEARKKCAQAFVFAVFPVFAHEVCKLGRHLLWPLHRIQKVVDEFVKRELIPYAHQLTDISQTRERTEERILLEKLKQSDLWGAYLAKLVEVGDQAVGVDTVGPHEHLNHQKETPPTPAAVAPPAIAASITPVQRSFPKRAQWLQERLAERGWNEHQFEKRRGPDWKTTVKILKGLPVRRNSLRHVVRGLNEWSTTKSKPPLTLDDIPND